MKTKHFLSLIFVIIVNNIGLSQIGSYVGNKVIFKYDSAGNQTLRLFEESHSMQRKSIANKEKIIKIYPNPSSGKFNLQIDTSLPFAKGKVYIYSTSAKLLEILEIKKTDKINIDLSGSPKGVYLIKVILDNGEKLNTKVLLK